MPVWGRPDSKTSRAGLPVVPGPVRWDVPPVFCTLLWWLSGATFQYAWPVYFFIHPSGWLSACGPNFFHFFFFRRCHRASAPQGRPRPVQGDVCGGRPGCAGRKHSRLGLGIFGCASCRLNHEQGSRCARDDNAAARPRQPLCNNCLLSGILCAHVLGALLSLRAPSWDTWE